METKEDTGLKPNPRITVFLSSYNHESYIAQAIECILNQTFSEFKLLIVDDCSNDSSWSIIEKYAEQDSRIQAVRNEMNEGGRYLMKFVENIETDYIAIAHSDDLWAIDKLEKQFNYLESNPSIVACFTWASFINEKGEIISYEKSGYGSTFNKENRSRFEWLNYFFKFGNCLCHPSLLIRTRAYEEYGLATFGLEALPDFCKWIRLVCKADIYLLKEELTLFRVLSDKSNTSAQSLANLSLVCIEDFLLLEEFLRVTKEDFFYAFPEAKKLVPPLSKGALMPDDMQNMRFLLAKLCLDDSRYYYNQFGLSMIYQLLNDRDSRFEINYLYGYNEASFLADKKKANIFSITHSEMFLRCDLHILSNTKPNEWQVESKLSFVNPDGTAVVRYELDRVKGKIEKVLFKPELRTFWQYKVISAATETGLKKVTGCNNPYSTDYGDLFYDDYPCYDIESVEEPKWIEIIFTAKYADTDEFAEYLQKKHQMVAELNSRAWKMLTVFRRLKAKLRNPKTSFSKNQH